MIRMTSIILLAAATTLGGCSGGNAPGMTATETGWSTKTNSVPGRRAAPRSIDIALHDGVDLSITEARTTAVRVARTASDSGDPLLLANAIEALQGAPDHAGPAIERGLISDNRGVRFVAAMAVGKLMLAEHLPRIEALMSDESDSVRAAAVYAQRQLGRSVSIQPILAMLRSDSPEVKGNAAYVLGEIGDRSAVPALRQAVGQGLARDPMVRRRMIDLQIAEAIVKLGGEAELDGIRAMLYAPAAEYGELIALAAQICGNLRDRQVRGDLMNLAMRDGQRRQPAEVRLAAARALAEIDGGNGPVDLPISYAGYDRPTVRAQAAMTLGSMTREPVLPTLSALLADGDPMVQVAAAGAVLQLDQRVVIGSPGR